jgi:hypothetical protein
MARRAHPGDGVRSACPESPGVDHPAASFERTIQAAADLDDGAGVSGARSLDRGKRFADPVTLRRPVFVSRSFLSELELNEFGFENRPLDL